MVYKSRVRSVSPRQCKDVATGKIYSVANYLISFVVVCNRLQMELFCLYLIDFKFFTEPSNHGRIVFLARIAVEILF